MTAPTRFDAESTLRKGAELEDATAQEIMGWALETFHPRLAVASSMADAVVIHLATQIASDVPVVWLDTGYHFAETRGMVDVVTTSHPIALNRVLPLLSVAQQDTEYGAKLHDRDPDACCRMRKVEPFERALAGYDAWASGIQRSDARSRATAGVVEWDVKRSMVKVNPIACWSDDDVDSYIARHGILVNPLLSDGFSSIGCEPCTRRTRDGEDARAGRWAGTGKTECGINT